MNKKAIITTVAILGITTIGGGALALTQQNKPKSTPQRQELALASTTVSPAQTAPSTQTTTAAAPATTITPAPTTSTNTSTTTTTQPAPAPAYGEDPSNPGIYVVFDKTSVMNSAGIAAGDQAAVDTIISGIMQWRYHLDSNSEANICYIAPIIKMESAGADYRTNPITQLKWCNTYVIAKYGSWSKALTLYNQTHFRSL
jgi:hypothetical protein